MEMEGSVDEKLMGSKVGMNNALAVDKNHGFYNLLHKSNARVIRCIVVAL
jgi:hypothetical protein